VVFNNFKLCGLFFLMWNYNQFLSSQINVRDSIVRAFIFNPSVTVQVPAGDLRFRTGLFYGVGGSIFYKTSRNFYWEGESYFFTGNRIQEKDVLNRIATKDGYIIAQDGGFADISLLFRGWNALISFGGMFLRLGPNRNCGFYLKAGTGMFQHKIRIEVRHNNVPMLDKEYKKGFDRLRGGLALQQELGYIFFSNNKRITFRTGLLCMQAFSRSLRGIVYDTGTSDSKNYTDLTIAIKISWMIPVYIRPSEYYYTR